MIGEDNYRGKGIGKQALKFLLNFGFEELKLDKIILDVNKQNEPAVKLYKSAGFTEVEEIENGTMVVMQLSLPTEQLGV